MTNPIENIILNTLHEMEILARIDVLERIHFTYVHVKFIIICDEFDPGFVQVIIPSFFSPNNSRERLATIIASHRITSKFKSIKIMNDGIGVNAVYELRITDSMPLAEVFKKAFFILKKSVSEFLLRMEIFIEEEDNELLTNFRINLN